jgi:hypothetical protein
MYHLKEKKVYQSFQHFEWDALRELAIIWDTSGWYDNHGLLDLEETKLIIQIYCL